MWRKYKEIKPDIIHCWSSMSSIYVLPILFFHKTPFFNSMIADAKCDFMSTEWFRSQLIFPFSKVILANSRSGLKAYYHEGKKGRVIYNGFNFDRLLHLNNKELIRDKYSLSTKIIVGMVAAFYPRKDYETYLSIAEEICRERQDVTFLAIGDGITREAYIERFSHIPQIVFTGNIINVEQVINVLDIGVLLSNSKQHLEGISNSILEMMALGKPVIASRGGGTDEIIHHLETGILIDPLSPKQFKKELLSLILNDKLRQKIGDNAIQSIKTNFSIDQMCSQITQIYDELISLP